ncbi:Stress-induced-phosphoprotein 1 [Halotydeus destructor]|nr:Stress-induced-phosphoprotein 1 [Halotydeus destructor]
MSEENKAQAVELKQQGNDFYKKKQFKQALECYSKAAELDPLDVTYLTNKAAVYFEQKQFDAVIKECEKAIEIGRENFTDFKLIAKAYSRMASAYKLKGDYKNAKTYFQKSLTEHRTPETLTKLSEVDKVIKEEERKAFVNPEISLQEKEKGNDFFKKGKYPDALKHYTEAIKRNPEDAKLYSNRAACYQKLAEFPSALRDTEECIKLEPDFVKGHIRKGMALLAMREHSRATTAFQKALELDPNSAEAMDGYRKCTVATMSNPEEVRKKAMSDPEVQQILGDPAMRLILEQMQSDPSAVREHLANPEVARKIEKLMEAGLIGIR